MSKRLNPYVLEGLRTSAIMATGDVLAQTVVEKKPVENIDLMRTMKFGSLGFIFVGPVLRFWYTLLDRKIGGPQNIKRVAKKVLVDQTVMAPTLNLAIASLVGVIKNEEPQHIKKRIMEQYPDIMKRNYMLWPAVQLINFSIVPLSYQVVFVQTVAVLWNCFLSQLLNSKGFK